MATILRWLTPLIFTALLLPAGASAEQSRDFGDYRVHYSAFSTDMLDADVARAYDITRSRYRGALNITVQKKTEKGYQPISAGVEASATTLTARVKEIAMRKISEGEAIYYIGEFSFADEDTLTFDVRVQPEGGDTAFALRFRQQFFVD